MKLIKAAKVNHQKYGDLNKKCPPYVHDLNPCSPIGGIV